MAPGTPGHVDTLHGSAKQLTMSSPFGHIFSVKSSIIEIFYWFVSFENISGKSVSLSINLGLSIQNWAIIEYYLEFQNKHILWI